MCGFGQVHDNERNGCCETCGKPLKSWKWVIMEVELEDGCDDDADQATEEVAEDERTWLG